MEIEQSGVNPANTITKDIPKGPETAPSGEELNVSMNIEQVIRSLSIETFVPQAFAMLEQLQQGLDNTIWAIRDSQNEGYFGRNAPLAHLEVLKSGMPLTDGVINRLLAEPLDPAARVVLRNAQKIIHGAIETYPAVPYYGADPAREFQIGKDMLGVALRMFSMPANYRA